MLLKPAKAWCVPTFASRPKDPVLGCDFSGVSCEMLWADLFINVASQPDELSMLAVIVSESTLSLLCVFTNDALYGLNDAGQRYASPFRDDVRPMDGICHIALERARQGKR